MPCWDSTQPMPARVVHARWQPGSAACSRRVATPYARTAGSGTPAARAVCATHAGLTEGTPSRAAPREGAAGGRAVSVGAATSTPWDPTMSTGSGPETAYVATAARPRPAAPATTPTRMRARHAQGDRLACREIRKGGTSTVSANMAATSHPITWVCPVRAAASDTGVPAAAVDVEPSAEVTGAPAGAPVSGSTAPPPPELDPELGEPPPVLPGLPEAGLVPPLGLAPDVFVVPPEVLVVVPVVVLVVVPVVLETVQDEPSFMHLSGIGADWRMFEGRVVALADRGRRDRARNAFHLLEAGFDQVLG